MEPLLLGYFLETPGLYIDEKRSAWRYLVYQFPRHVTTMKREEKALRLLLKRGFDNGEQQGEN